MAFKVFHLFVLSCLYCTAASIPRGVAESLASFYKPGVTFRCLDQSKEIPFEYVNDDYCDCPDGSDEPGTSACPSGKFHCTNAGYKPLNILSSRVNDGICDCCDGTDEWDGNIECVNNCKELGKKMREEMDRVRQLQEEGFKLKLQFIQEGKQAKEEKQVKLGELEKLKVELEATKIELEQKKNDAEAPEKEAKEKHEEIWQAELDRRKADRESLQAEIAFTELDENGDSKVDLAEIKAQVQFDVDSNGEVSDDEAREHLEGEEASDLAHFKEKVWPHIKDFYKPPGAPTPKGDTEDVVPEPPKADKPLSNDEDFIDDDDDDYDDEEEDDEEIYEDKKLRPGLRHPRHETTITPTSTMPVLTVPQMEEEAREENSTDGEDKMPDYDESTQQLIAAADEARQQFKDAENKLKNTENEIRDLQTYLGLDFGPDDEFSVLKGNCFEFTDREYVYKLCGFERATQKSKTGGSETTLGNWGKWTGPDDDKYASQIYENGQSCWNGPNRSVKVNFKCGLENKVTGASEPSRCEYMFDFETPSRCVHSSAKPGADKPHDEL